MKKLQMNFAKSLNAIDGTPVMKSEKDKMTQADLLLGILGRQTKSPDPIKIMLLGLELSKTRALEVDKADAETIKRIVERDEDTFDIYRAQVLETIQDAMNARPEPKGK